jgi:hypothetical protein
MTASLGLGAGFFLFHSDPLPAAAVWAAGTLVDVDHFFDLWAYQKHRRPGEKLFEVFSGHYWVRSYLFLHAMEGIPVLGALIFITGQPWLWGGAFLGYTGHMLMDLFGNRCTPFCYFLSYRIYQRFDARSCWKVGRPLSKAPPGLTPPG